MDEAEEFRECEACAAKPGTPALCGPCLHNRELIHLLQKRAEGWRTKAMMAEHEAERGRFRLDGMGAALRVVAEVLGDSKA